MRSTLKFLVRLYLLLSVLAGVPASASQGVLCLAPRGHLAIEAGETRCVDSAAYATSGKFGLVGSRMPPNGCRDCVDIPVGTPMLGETHGHGTAPCFQPVVAGPLLAVVRAADPRATSIQAGWANRPALGAAFPPFRTMILRN